MSNITALFSATFCYDNAMLYHNGVLVAIVVDGLRFATRHEASAYVQSLGFTSEEAGDLIVNALQMVNI